MIIWIMGLNGAGKSSVARELEALFMQQQKAVIILDGNHLREIFEQKSYDRASRIALGIRYANLAKSLSSKDNVIIIAANGMLAEVCDYNRAHLPNYLEVFLDVPLEILKKRDSSEIYSRFERGLIANVGGLDLEVDTPNPHIHIPYTPTKSPRDIAHCIFAATQGAQPAQNPKPHTPNPLLSTKAQTLKNLSGKLKYGKILPLWILTKDEFQSPSAFQAFLKELESSPFEHFVVRSSSSSEDTSVSSNAGAYESLLDVGLGDMEEAIKQVFASYGNSSLGNHLQNPSAPLHCDARSSASHSQGETILQSNTANTKIVNLSVAKSQFNKSLDSEISESETQTNATTQKANSSIADEVRGLSKNCAEINATTPNGNSKILSENINETAAVSLGDFKGCQGGGEGVTLKVMTEADNADSLMEPKAKSTLAKSGKETTQGSEEVLIQPMALNILAAGVCFNTQPKTNAPYYVIEYSLESTHAITAGESRTKTFYVAHYDDVDMSDFDDPYVPRIIKLMREIESLIPNTSLDMEFGLSESESYCFQVRPLILQENRIYPSHKTQLTLIQDKIEQILKPHIRLYGQKGILGVMPDWNPAEIIGLHPRALALSLYARLITDSAYSRERARYGYKDVSANPLIFSLHGKPYVDVRASFNSFLPRPLRRELSQKLTDYYLNQLRQNPQWHDKVEFEILFDSYYFDTPKRLKKLLDFGFNQNEIDELQSALNTLTHNIIKDKIYLQDIAKVENLSKNREQILNSNAPLLEKIYWLLQDCQNYGTSAFVGLARMGFMAMGFLNALVKEGILDKEQKDRFITSLECVTTSLSKDLGALDREDFLRKYGHLRPGTYDILSPRYDEHFEFYFKADSKRQNNPQAHEQKESFALTLSQMKAIDSLLQSHNIGCDVIGLFDFIAMGIIHRESSKFEFSKNLSEALRLIGRLGKSYGLSIEDMSYCDVDIFFKAYSTSSNLERLILESIESNKSAHEIQEAIILPPLVCSPKDVLGFYVLESMPNFITQKRVSAPVVLLDESFLAMEADSKIADSLRGKIVCISRADPGFDWLFSHSIAALITEFGGANSHMAIRANELGIPAIIGCGEKFSVWANAKSLQIDCANSKVEILS